MATRSWNRAELIGNLTRDPELRYTPSGAAVVTFSIATNRTYTVDGEKKEDVDFHRIVAWNKLAELCSQLLKKGNRVFVSGRLQNRSWEDQSGTQKQTTEIVIEDMIILTSRSSTEEFNEDVSRESSVVSSQTSVKPKEKEEEVVEAPAELESDEASAESDKEEKPKKAPENESVNPDDIPF